MPTRFVRVNYVGIPRYTDIEAAFTQEVVGQVQDLIEGNTDAGAVMRWFDTAMADAQAEAFVAGRAVKRQRSRTGINQSEESMLVDRLNHQRRYFRRFVADIENGRGRMDYLQRAGLYGKSLWSLFGRGETVDWDDPATEKRYHWVLDPSAENCRDCIERTKRSMQQGGFTLEELTAMGWPGESDTECIVHCRCHIRVTKTARPVLPPDDELRGVTPPAGSGPLARVPSPPDGRGANEPEPLGGPPGAPRVGTPMPRPEPVARHPVVETLERYILKPDEATDGLPTLPAAGIPMVSIAAPPIQGFLRAARAPRMAAAFAAQLPELLTYPASIDASDVRRRYYGYGGYADLERDAATGAWMLVGLAMAAQPAKTAMLSEWDEREHPRNGDGEFALKVLVPPDVAAIQDMPRLREAVMRAVAHELAKNASPVAMDHVGTVRIARSGAKHTVRGAASRFTVLSLLAIRSVLSRATYIGSADEKKGDRNTKAWHYFSTPLEIEGERKILYTRVRELYDGRRFYHIDEFAPGAGISGPALSEQRIRPSATGATLILLQEAFGD